MAWTDERRELVVKLWKEGLSASVVAQRVGGTTRNAVIGIIHRMGLSGRSTTSRMKTVRKAASRPRKRVLMPAADRIAPPRSFREFKTHGQLMLFRHEDRAASPLPPPSETDIARITFADFERGKHCSFIPGDPKAGGKMFCGEVPVPGLPYCEHHARRCYQSSDVSVRVSEPTKELEHA